MKDLRSRTAPVLEFTGGIGERKLPSFAAAGSYYLFMSLVPIVMIVCCILPYTPLSQDLVLGYVDQYFSESLGKIVRQIVSAVYRSNAATLTVSIVMTLWSASASMKAIMRGIDAAYDMRRHDNAVIFSLKALVYMVVLIIGLIVSLIIMVYGGEILKLLKTYLPDFTVFDYFLTGIRFLVIMAFLTVIFLFLYVFGSAERVRILRQLPGALFAAAVWVIFSAVFSWYVNISNKYGAYGFIGTIMVAMMWMNYCLLFLLIGGYINSRLDKSIGK